MKKKTPTSVNFETWIEPIKDYYSAVYGLKNLVSAGVLLFSRLDASDQKSVILEVNELPSELKAAVDEILAVLEKTKPTNNRHRRRAESSKTG